LPAKLSPSDQRRFEDFGEDELVEKLFICWCQGMVKPREIAAKLGLSVEEVTDLNSFAGTLSRHLRRKIFGGWCSLQRFFRMTRLSRSVSLAAQDHETGFGVLCRS
jgi:hypothetical protein